MRSLVHCRGRLIRQKGKLSNRLNELSEACLRALLEPVEDVDQSWFSSLLEQAPTPHQAQKMTRSELRNCSTNIASVVSMPILRQQPFPGVAPMAPPEAIEIAVLAPQLQLPRSQIKDLELQMDEMIERWCQALFKTNSDSTRDE